MRIVSLFALIVIAVSCALSGTHVLHQTRHAGEPFLSPTQPAAFLEGNRWTYPTIALSRTRTSSRLIPPGASFIIKGKTEDLSNGTWRHVADTISVYKGGLLMRQAIIFPGDSSARFNRMPTEFEIRLYSYDEQGRLLQERDLDHHVVDYIGSYVFDQTTTYVYKDSGQLSNSLVANNFLGPESAPFMRSSYTYRTGGELGVILTEISLDNTWTPYERLTFYNDASGLPDSMTQERWASAWLRESKTVYLRPSPDTLIARRSSSGEEIISLYKMDNAHGVVLGSDKFIYLGGQLYNHDTYRASVTPGPSLLLLSPLPGDRYFDSDTISVRFLGTGESTVNLQFNADYGQMWSTFASGLQDTGAGVFLWTPGTGLGGYTRIKAVAGTASSEMEGTCNILPGREFLAETTVTIRCGVFSTGYIGADPQGFSPGFSRDYPGFHYKGNPNALFSGGVFVGQTGGPLCGMIGSFFLRTFEPEVPFDGFTADATFDQRTTCSLKESLPNYLVAVTQSTASRKGDDFIIFTYDFKNPSQTPLSDFFVGLFADWDIGNSSSNSGGVDSLRGLAYEYDPTGPDRNYYGVVALSGVSGGVVTPNFPTTSFMESHQFGVVGSGADLRTFVGSGPFGIPPGGTQSVSFAILAGPSLAGLQARADSARVLWKQTVSSVEPVLNERRPLQFTLAQNYPNPFNPSTKIMFEIAENVWTTLKVYNVLGQEVRTLVNEMRKPGSYEETLDANILPSGVYFYRLEAGNFRQTKRLVLIR